jgi:hypothetical protein
MSNVLLEIPGETFVDVTRRTEETRLSVEKCKAKIDESQTAMKSIETRQKCAAYEDNRVTEKLDALRLYMNRIGK